MVSIIRSAPYIPFSAKLPEILQMEPPVELQIGLPPVVLAKPDRPDQFRKRPEFRGQTIALPRSHRGSMPSVAFPSPVRSSDIAPDSGASQHPSEGVVAVGHPVEEHRHRHHPLPWVSRHSGEIDRSRQLPIPLRNRAQDFIFPSTFRGTPCQIPDIFPRLTKMQGKPHLQIGSQMPDYEHRAIDTRWEDKRQRHWPQVGVLIG